MGLSSIFDALMQYVTSNFAPLLIGVVAGAYIAKPKNKNKQANGEVRPNVPINNSNPFSNTTNPFNKGGGGPF